jgi:phosphoglycerate dehydrogenase-like enzyme
VTILVALARRLADDYGARIEQAEGSRVRLLRLRGDPGEADLEPVEIAIYGLYEGSLSFAELADRMPNLRWIHSTGAGIESFASAKLADRGVLVTNSSGVYAPAMAEYAIGGMVAIARDLPRLLAQQRRRTWKHEAISGTELYGKQVGIVGYGATGRYLATVCRVLGMTVWATRRKPMLTSGEPIERLLPPEGIHELLAASDYIVLTASLNSTTRHLIGAAELASVKRGAVLVNVARGALIDERALLAALDDGTVGGAVLDVTETQPLPQACPLWQHPRVIVTPHISGGSPEGWTRSMELFLANLPLYLDGEHGRLGNLVALADHI